MVCGCRCIKCKSKGLKSFSFVAADGFDEMHHTCLMCGTHFNHLDGEIILIAKHAISLILLHLPVSNKSRIVKEQIKITHIGSFCL